MDAGISQLAANVSSQTSIAPSVQEKNPANGSFGEFAEELLSISNSFEAMNKGAPEMGRYSNDLNGMVNFTRDITETRVAFSRAETAVGLYSNIIGSMKGMISLLRGN
jgi:hypothetical protein